MILVVADCQSGRVWTLATSEFLLPAVGVAHPVGISGSYLFPGVSLDRVIVSVR